MTAMTVPRYVQEILSRCTWWLGEGSEPGYTIAIHKKSPYSYASTLRTDAGRLCSWADRNTPEGLDTACVVSCPKGTHYEDQWAVVTIYDPVMRQIERFIGNNENI